MFAMTLRKTREWEDFYLEQIGAADKALDNMEFDTSSSAVETDLPIDTDTFELLEEAIGDEDDDDGGASEQMAVSA